MQNIRSAAQGRIQKIVLGGAQWNWVAEDDEVRRRRRWGGDVWAGSLPLGLPSRLGERHISSSSGVWGGAPTANAFGHYTRNFVRFHACFSAFWNITGKANKTNPIRPLMQPLVWRGHVPPVWIRPCSSMRTSGTYKIKPTIRQS